MAGFLAGILEGRRRAVAALEAQVPELERRAASRGPVRDFRACLARPGMSLVAEIKRRSPSKGDLAPSLDPARMAAAYERGGASALSVLCEPQFFAGSADDLEAARAATSLPALWKDFVVEPVQLLEARARGADACLLIVRVLGPRTPDLVAECRRLGLFALVEVFDEGDLDVALGGGADIVGINHRDLESFEEDPGATLRLRPLIPEGIVLVAESAISCREDVVALEEAGVDAVLVGEALVRSPDPEAKVRELLGR